MRSLMPNTDHLPRTERGRQRAEELLNQAIDIFIELGYERTSLDRIISRAGGSRSTIYQVYGNKEGLFVAALQMMADEIYQSYMADYRHGRTLEEDFAAFGRIYLSGMLNPRAVGACRLIFAETPRLTEIGAWFYREGIAKSYTGFAKVLENHLDAPLPELEDAAKRYIEMLRGPLFMKALCHPGTVFSQQALDEESRRAADIICTWLRARWPERKNNA